MHDFIRTHIEEFAQLHPRTEALETPIEDPKKVNWYWEINKIDNNTNP